VDGNICADLAPLRQYESAVPATKPNASDDPDAEIHPDTHAEANIQATPAPATPTTTTLTVVQVPLPLPDPRPDRSANRSEGWVGVRIGITHVDNKVVRRFPRVTVLR
jgi:hypothetical protein